jgi:hypothetical protein
MDDATAFETMATAMQERGIVTADQVASDRVAIAAGQNQPSQAPALTTPLPSSVNVSPASNPEASAIDAMVFEGASSPAAYKFDVPASMAGVEYDRTGELEIRQLFHSEGVPASIGNFIGSLHNKAIANPMTDAQWAASKEQCRADLQRTWGGDADKNLAVAQREFDRMASQQPRLSEMRAASRLEWNPWVIKTLYNFAIAKGRG